MKKDTFKWSVPTNTPTYNSWKSMHNRCLYNNTNSKYYKAKGIVICDRWLNNFDNFFADMGERPIGTTLDRKDPNGNYEPSNCRWASHRDQNNNKYNLTSITYNGKTQTIGQWAYELDLTNSELTRAYKRYSSYNATTFEEIFFSGRLYSKRKAERVNECKICNGTSSTKWRKDGLLCNTCYHRALRWSKKENRNIEEYHEWYNRF